MVIGSTLGSGLEGINKGFSAVGAAADKVSKVSNSDNPVGDLASSAVDLLQGKIQVQASAKVLEAEGQVMGSLIDIKV